MNTLRLLFQQEAKSRLLLTVSRFLASIFLLLLLALPTLAQEVASTVELGEVEVKADRIIHKTDGLLLYPSEQQKASSRSGYSLLQQLTLPNIRVDEVAHSISAIDQRGSVQIRINGIIADKAEMLSLDPKSIRKIDFIDNPGVRYGDGIAYVIDITTRRADNGYTLGTSLTQALTTRDGDYTVYGKWNTGKSELSLNYSFGYRDFKGIRTEETAHYHLNDGSIYTIQRNDLASRNRSLSNQMKLTYNLADSSRYVFQASLSGDFSHVPGDFSQKQIVDGTQTYTALEQQQSQSSSPVLDLYYFQQFTPRQSLTLNAVGTYIGTQSSDSYNEGSPYRYNVDGRTYSLLSEAIYENRLKPFTLSAGLNYSQKYTNNEYTGDVSSVTPMHHNRVYLFSEATLLGRHRRQLPALPSASPFVQLLEFLSESSPELQLHSLPATKLQFPAERTHLTGGHDQRCCHPHQPHGMDCRQSRPQAQPGNVSHPPAVVQQHPPASLCTRLLQEMSSPQHGGVRTHVRRPVHLYPAQPERD